MCPAALLDDMALATAASPEKASAAAQAPLGGNYPRNHSITGDSGVSRAINDMKFALLVDRVSYKDSTKPQGYEVGAIRNRLAMPEAYTQASANEIEYLIRNGCTIMPGICLGGTKLENWTGQQLVFLDFDNDEAVKRRGLAILEPDEALQRACDNELDPLFLYSSHSATINPYNPRFHMVFYLSSVLRDKEKMRRVHDQLLQIYPEADPCSRDLTRMFFSPGKEVWLCQD